MSSAHGPEGAADHDGESVAFVPPLSTLECQLFESLIHHLVEKGVLTRNDALSVVQTVAEVKRGEQEEGQLPSQETAKDLRALEILYDSFFLLPDGSGSLGAGDANIVQLRPPRHRNGPEFPRDS